MEKITLNGREYNIGFDFSSLLEVEEQTGKAFTEIDHANSRENLQFIYSCLKAFNDGMPTFREWLHEIKNVADVTRISNAISFYISAFFAIPAVSEQHVPENEDKGDGDNESPNQ